jgi:iron complex transport system permease protein
MSTLVDLVPTGVVTLPTSRRARLVAITVVLSVAVMGVSMLIGPAGVAPKATLLELLDHLPGVRTSSGLNRIEAGIVWEVRFPRVVLGMLVGGLLALAGSTYQAVFRNPLADPYTLGSAAGAGLGATMVIVSGAPRELVPPAAFVGAVIAVATAMAVSRFADRDRSPATLLLAGVATTSFLTAAQTYLQQRNADTLRDVYTWILGRLGRASWSDVATVTPYAVVSLVVLCSITRSLDVLAVGDDEARSLGVRPGRIRWIALVGATLATAAAVAVSGLISFVGLIVPHMVRRLLGASNRLVVPVSALAGGAFLCLADVAARTIQAPAEVPIGVVTAFCGAPFFVLVLRTARTR